MPSARTPRRNGPFAPLSAYYPRDDAMLTIDADEDDLAEVLWARGLAYCATDYRLDGFISDVALRAGLVLRRKRMAKVLDAAEKLATVCGDQSPWIREDGGYRIRQWIKWNPSKDEVERKRKADVERKKPEDDPPPDPNGSGADSARNPNGSGADSAHQIRSDQIRSTSDQTNPISPSKDGPSTSSNETREAKPEGPSPDTTSINPPTDYTPHHVAWTLDELVAQIHEMRPGWKPVLIRNPVRRMLDKGISLERVALAAYAVASDPTSKFPIRLTEDGWWWDEHDTRRQQSDATITAGVAA